MGKGGIGMEPVGRICWHKISNDEHDEMMDGEKMRKEKWHFNPGVAMKCVRLGRCDPHVSIVRCR